MDKNASLAHKIACTVFYPTLRRARLFVNLVNMGSFYI